MWISWSARSSEACPSIEGPSSRSAGQGETIHYLSVEGPGVAALGLREKRSKAHDLPCDRYAGGIHHLCFDVPSREVVDERTRLLRGHRAWIDSGPAEFDYTPGYFAVFFYDPDGIKLELLHRPTYWEWQPISTNRPALAASSA